MKICWRTSFAALLSAGAASAAPTVTITPSTGARFFAGQRFDIRVEAKGTGPYSATLSIDGHPAKFSSPANAGSPSLETDGITRTGFGGFNLRGFSARRAGLHKIEASVTDATGTTTAGATFAVQSAGHRDEGRLTRNIIILLGDGMGAAHRTAARLVRYGVTGGDPDGFLAMDGFPGTGLVTTHSLNSIVTDSSPGMGCYTTGNHSQNGQEGVYPANVTNPFYQPRVEYMAEYLRRMKGTSTGIVTTADVEDATPAANAVHTGNRNLGQGIVDQYLDERGNTGLVVLLGGGRRWFLPSTKFGSSRSTSNDYANLPPDLVAAWNIPTAGAVDPDRDLIADFRAAGFEYAETSTDLKAAIARPPSKLLGLFGYGNMNVALDKIAKRRNPSAPGIVDDYHAPDQPMLDEMTEAALRVLSKNRHGFFLMVEGAHIDKQSHLMDAERTVGEVLELDRAVGVARSWADKLGHTVVIVVADHECAGFSIIGALQGGIGALKALPSDAAGAGPDAQPARQARVGTYELAGFPRYKVLADGYPETFDVEGKLLFGYGADGDRYESWLTRPQPVIDSLLSNGIKTEMRDKGYVDQPYQRGTAGSREDQDGFFVRGQATGREQGVHTASDIPISAYSSGGSAWKKFVGVQKNTDVFFKLLESAMGGGDGGYHQAPRSRAAQE
jgi:alkaline phosphatase